MNVLDAVEQRCAALSPMPAVVLRLNEVLADPHCDAAAVVDAIRYDPALTTHVLRVANSAESAASQEVSSVNDAVVRLGNRRVVEIAIANTVQKFFHSQEVCRADIRKDLWRHAIASALATELLARKERASLRGTLFTAALLHDVGRLAINEFVEQSYERILELVKTRHASFVEAEREVLGTDHAQVGNRIAEMQSFPDPISRAIRWHHAPDQLETRDPVVEMICLSDVLCGLVGIQSGWDGLASAVPRALLDAFQQSQSSLQAFLTDLVAALRGVEKRFGLSV
ncbi:MAG: HDOD domain-containing protein [Planctomycetota bacterium]